MNIKTYTVTSSPDYQLFSSPVPPAPRISDVRFLLYTIVQHIKADKYVHLKIAHENKTNLSLDYQRFSASSLPALTLLTFIFIHYVH